MAANRAVGQAGEDWFEAVTGLAKNTSEFFVTASGRRRIPDFIDDLGKAWFEVKNVARLSFTAQIRETSQLAALTGNRYFVVVRTGTYISKPLQEAADSGALTIIRII